MGRTLALATLAWALAANLAAAQGIADTLAAVRARYPAVISGTHAAEILNETAWTHRAEGWALLGKASGNNCPQPTTGTRISCDFLIRQTGDRWMGQDVLIDGPGDGHDGPGHVVGSINPQADMTGLISSGARSVVLPVNPSGSVVITPPPAGWETAVDALAGLLASLEARVAQMSTELSIVQQRLAAFQEQASSMGARMDGQISALEARVAALEARPVVQGCRAVARLGFANVPLSCTLH